jgi:xanthine/uracil/vitamin C permease (AzgA family)
MPQSLVLAVGAGIGLFIAYVFSPRFISTCALSYFLLSIGSLAWDLEALVSSEATQSTLSVSAGVKLRTTSVRTCQVTVLAECCKILLSGLVSSWEGMFRLLTPKPPAS